MTDMLLRIAPSGPFYGDPGLRVGPGSLGVIARAHGVATATALMPVPTGSPTAIPGLGDTVGGTVPPFAVDMRPGYLYSVEVSERVQGDSLTADASVTMYYRLHYTESNTWGAWQALSPYPVVLPATALTTDAQPFADAQDALFNLSVTANVNQIEIGVVSSLAAWIATPRCFAVVSEYMPAAPIV